MKREKLGACLSISGAYLTILNDEALVNAWLQHLQHLVVLHVIADMLQNIAVGYDSQGSENNPDWDVNLDVRDGSFHDIPQLSKMIKDGRRA